MRSFKKVIKNLLKKSITISVSESCTGGLLSSKITSEHGVSKIFNMGLITYSNKAKSNLLNINPYNLKKYGAVSHKVTFLMAKNLKQISNSKLCISTTGIAGPSGGTQEKPVGTVVFAVETSDQQEIRTMRFYGGRELVNYQASQFALDMVRRILEDRD